MWQAADRAGCQSCCKLDTAAGRPADCTVPTAGIQAGTKAGTRAGALSPDAAFPLRPGSAALNPSGCMAAQVWTPSPDSKAAARTSNWLPQGTVFRGADLK